MKLLVFSFIHYICVILHSITLSYEYLMFNIVNYNRSIKMFFFWIFLIFERPQHSLVSFLYKMLSGLHFYMHTKLLVLLSLIILFSFPTEKFIWYSIKLFRIIMIQNRIIFGTTMNKQIERRICYLKLGTYASTLI